MCRLMLAVSITLMLQQKNNRATPRYLLWQKLHYSTDGHQLRLKKGEDQGSSIGVTQPPHWREYIERE